jgi:Fic family protein
MVYAMLEKITDLKNKLDALRPFPKSVLDNLNQWFEVELTYSSNAIEGNTLTRQETALVIEKGLTVGGKPMKDHLEAINHRDALQHMQKMVGHKTLILDDILALHRLILKGIDDTNAGCIRTVPVRISGSMVVLPNPLKVPTLMEEFMKWLQKQEEDSVTLAAKAHYKLVTIHPFVDGNGRTARLLMNLILMQHGYPPAILSSRERLNYIKSLEKAQLGGSLEDYLNIIYQAVLQSLNIYLKALQQEVPESIEDVDALLQVGSLAKATQESVATIRYWTKLGLLKVTTTTPSGYQLYATQMIGQCKRIRDLQEERYTLDEIANMVNN